MSTQYYRFSLEKYNGSKSKHTCPNCKNKGVFTRYLDNETGKYLSDEVGRCSREVKCGHHYKPKQYFIDHPEMSNNYSYTNPAPVEIIDKTEYFSFIDFEWVKWSRENYNKNRLILFFAKRFDTETIASVIKRYHIGTSNHWDGATIFWQIDTKGDARTGKVMLYNPETGKRVKQPFEHFTFVHKIDEPENPYSNRGKFLLDQCLFGEHLLKIYPEMPVVIVESEKTAIIASIYYPDSIWLATGGLSNLSPKMCEVLRGREILLYPDLNAYSKWAEKMKGLQHIANFTITDKLEKIANEEERLQNLDLADYLLRYDYMEFIQHKNSNPLNS